VSTQPTKHPHGHHPLTPHRRSTTARAALSLGALSLLATGVDHIQQSTPERFESARTPRFDGKRADRHDGPEILEENRQYIRDFDQVAETTSTAQDLYDRSRGRSEASPFQSCGPARCRAWKQSSAPSAARPSCASRTLAMPTGGPARIRQATAGTRRSHVTESTSRLWRRVAR
jgi:hypothetical protein